MRTGPFELLRPLATGGMAELWEAQHASGVVAVKFVRIVGDDARAMFADEIRAHARLLHPHVLQVLDMGEVEESSPNGPAVGTPWLALEYVSGGDLRTLIRHEVLEWPEIFTVLAATLDALTHAHARGVIHRDLKPANILLADAHDARPGLKLADFGVAHFLGEALPSPAEPLVAGTPSILAPEQCRSAVREYGPWTDLYALGCVATKLSTGAYPFRIRNLPQALLAHSAKTPPVLEPRVQVPDGFAAWVSRLLQKAPRDRYRSAASALAALWRLGCDEAPQNAPLQASFAAIRTRYRNLDTASTFPRRWRVPGPDVLPRPLVDAGLGLFPLRVRPPVGHQVAREQAWDALRRVHTTRSPEVLVVTGPSGSGLSHLGTWLCEAAAAEGLAEIVPVRGRADDRPQDALVRALEQLLQVEGASGDELTEGIRESLLLFGQDDPDLVQALTRVLDQSDGGSQGLRHGALRRLVVGRASSAVVVWIDDAHLAPDAVQFVEATLGSVRDAPLLFLLALPENERLSCNLEAPFVHLGPLGRADRTDLLQKLLPLAAPLEARLVATHGGLSGRLVRAVDRLFRSGALELGPAGYGAEASVALEVDASLVPGWLDGLIPGLEAALLRAALLGSHVSDRLWAATCDRLRGDLIAPSILVRLLLERLKREGLARAQGDEGWCFEQDALREALVARASAERLREAHADLAEVLRPEAGAEYRVARHLAAAGREDEALDIYVWLVDECSPGIRREDVRGAVEEGLEVARRLELPEDDVRVDTLQAWRALLRAGRFDQNAFIETLLDEARHRGWRRCEAAALSGLANTGGSIDAARAAFTDAPPCPVVMAAMSTLAVAMYRSGQAQASLDFVSVPLRYARVEGIDWLEDLILANRFGPLTDLGHPGDPEELEQRARLATARGDLRRAVFWWGHVGEAAYMRRDLEASDRAHLRALALADLYGSKVLLTLLNLAVNALERSDADTMRGYLDRAHLAADPRFDRSVASLEICWAALVGEPGLLGPRVDRYRRATGHGDKQDVALLEQAACLLDAPDPAAAAEVRELT